jgi:predicted ATP-grasp superfamily ATP-dependent carboligase
MLRNTNPPLGEAVFRPGLGHHLDAGFLAGASETAKARIDTSTPVLILGGKENSISLARSYGRAGITVRASGSGSCWALYSRFCRTSFRIPFGVDPSQFWSELLLSEDSSLAGHMVLPCSDEAITFVAENRDALLERYILAEADPALQLALLDKQRTLELAAAAGIGAPKFWPVTTSADLEAIRDAISFPVLVKPVLSHKFARVFGRKLFIVESGYDELVAKVQLAHQHGLDVVVVEMIPGPDSLLSSYYSYIDTEGNSLFHFTKRIIRRFPTNRGGACYHITEWLPETAEAGRKFFQAIGFQGLGNVEFKRDPRDGKLKVIEINGRFTAAQELLVRSGAPIDLIIYCHLSGQPGPQFSTYRQFMRFWYPARDFLAFLELRRRDELSLVEWVRSVFPLRQITPLFSLRDPAPMLGAAAAIVQRLIRGHAAEASSERPSR